MQSVLSVIYPAQCIGCGGLVASAGALCGSCWGEVAFVQGSTCLKCGCPLPGEALGDETAQCDDCLKTERPWDRGWAALVYHGVGRKLVMGLKHGDRHDLARPIAAWMSARLPADIDPDTVLVPVPIHWRRMIKRRFNQSALLASAVSRNLNLEHCPDGLIRKAHTRPQEGTGYQERFDRQAGTIGINPKRVEHLAVRPVLLVDDVMTSGATLHEAARALHAAGIARVNTIVCARVVKNY